MVPGSTLRLVALALALYAVYTALHLPAMLIGPSVALLIVCFAAQAVFAGAAAVGIWTGRSWAAAAAIALAAAIAATQLSEILLGVVPYLRAVLISVAAIVAALVLAAHLTRRPLHTQGG